MANKTTVEQWRALVAFAETGTYAKAAGRLYRSPSSVFDAIKQLSERLGVTLLYVDGRRTFITEEGHALIRRARWIISEMEQLETLAANFNKEWEAEVGVAVEVIFPTHWLREILKRFDGVPEVLRVQIHETALSQTRELLTEAKVDLAILPEVPEGYVGRMLTSLPFVAVACPDHVLLNERGPIRLNELVTQRQIVIRDAGAAPNDAGWLVGDRRWTVADMRRRIDCVRDGLGYAWLPVPMIADDLRSGTLVEIPLREGAKREVPLYLTFADRENAGPGVSKFADIVSNFCDDLSESKIE